MEDRHTDSCRDLSSKICEKIKKERIRPKPRWTFTVKNIAFWSAFAVSLIAGGLAASTIIFMQANSDFDLRGSLAGGFLNFIVFTLPYFWLAAFLLFVLAGYFYLRHTKTGYRYRFAFVLTAIISASLLFGLLAHRAGLGRNLEGLTRQKVPFYDEMGFNRAKMWVQPDKGFLAGTVTNVISINNFEINDFTRRIWQIEMARTRLRKDVIIIPGAHIKIIGEKTGVTSFRAFEIRPWGLKCFEETCQRR